MYPTPRTVLMRSSSPASSASFRRTLPMWTSMLRSNGSNARPSTRWLMSSRVTTRPAAESSVCSRSNSTVVRSTSVLFLSTVRVAGSIVMSPTVTDGRRVLLARLHAAQHGANPRGQLARVEGLGQVVVGPDLQADDAVDVFAAGRQQDDRHGRAPPERAKYLEAVLLGQHHIENDQFVGAAGCEIDGAGAGVVGIHFEAFAAQKFAYQIAELPVVVDDEDRPGHGRSDCPRKRAPYCEERESRRKEFVKPAETALLLVLPLRCG